MFKINNLSFKYNKNDIFDNISFDIKSGEFLYLMGPNSSGKYRY